MNLSASTININSGTIIKWHPLTKKLATLLTNAYYIGNQQDYLTEVSQLFNCYKSLPIHNVSVINVGGNEYQVIGGCFNPVFNIKEVNKDNTIFLNYKTSRKNAKPEHLKRVQTEFKQDVIDFIYLDFIRSISILSLKRPGAIVKVLRTLNKTYKSEIWHEIFDSNKDFFRQTDLAYILDITPDTLKKQAKSLIKKPNDKSTLEQLPNAEKTQQ